MGRGVCGTAVARSASIVVPDAHDSPSHIACDAASRSELVVPMRRGEPTLDVLDLDSPRPGHFDEVDRDGCERLVALLMAEVFRAVAERILYAAIDACAAPPLRSCNA